ncbi:MAG: hypothetical protein QXH86_00205 [Ignisphaera sp.]
MVRKTLASFFNRIKLLENAIENLYTIPRLFSKRIYGKDFRCEEIRRGVYRCYSRSEARLVALYSLEDSFARIEEMEYIDFLTHLKRYISTLAPPGCSLVSISSVTPLNPDSYLSKINSKLQMKLVELESDKANTRLRSLVERLMEIRKRVLSGMIPIETSVLAAVICRDTKAYEDMLVNMPQVSKQILGISLKSVRDFEKISQLINFRQWQA